METNNLLKTIEGASASDIAIIAKEIKERLADQKRIEALDVQNRKKFEASRFSVILEKPEVIELTEEERAEFKIKLEAFKIAEANRTESIRLDAERIAEANRLKSQSLIDFINANYEEPTRSSLLASIKGILFQWL